MQFAHMVCPHTLKLNTRLGFRNLELMHRTQASSSMVVNLDFNSQIIRILVTACGVVFVELKSTKVRLMQRFGVHPTSEKRKKFKIQ